MKLNFLFPLSFALVVIISFTACEEEDTTPEVVSNTLHFAFKTPDWERTIDCTHLDLEPMYASDELDYIFATSASTKSTFFLVLPSDVNEYAKPENIKKYAISEHGEITEGPFSFSLKLPVTQDGSYLYSEFGQSEESYNEICFH